MGKKYLVEVACIAIEVDRHLSGGKTAVSYDYGICIPTNVLLSTRFT